MSRSIGEWLRSRQGKLAIIGTAVAIVAIGAFVATALATDRPTFCGRCHEMQPYVDAWQQGPHKDVWCIDCHVNAGLPARFAHKPEALKEVVNHVRGENKFPRPEPAVVPNERCLRCHPEPGPKDPARGFIHTEHQKVAGCEQCHADVGHRVPNATLQAAGIFDPAAAKKRDAARVADVASPGKGVANLKDHPDVVCSACHDMARTGCSACHEVPKQPDHSKYKECTQCHVPGATWAFTHPSAKATCTDCHKAPTNAVHKGRTNCPQCHAVGKSFKFKHPSESNCANCHRAPTKHFGPDCASCHSPGTPFASATLNHPSTGGHSFRSFPCTKCHPSGFASASCTCHGGNPPSD